MQCNPSPRGNLKVTAAAADGVLRRGLAHGHGEGGAQLTLLLVPDVGRVVQVVAVVKLGAVGRRSLLGRLVIVYRHGYDFSCRAYSGGPRPPAARYGCLGFPSASSLPSVGGGRPEGEFRPLEANFDRLPKVTDGAKTSAKELSCPLPTRTGRSWRSRMDDYQELLLLPPQPHAATKNERARNG